MKKTTLAAALGGALLLTTLAESALAQGAWRPGDELRGHAARVETNGVTNTVYFNADGSARIVTPAGNEVPARWTADSGMLCLQGADARECWPYQYAFQAGQPVDLTSDCASVSRWTALSTEPPASPPMERRMGERG